MAVYEIGDVLNLSRAVGLSLLGFVRAISFRFGKLSFMRRLVGISHTCIIQAGGVVELGFRYYASKWGIANSKD